MQTFRGIVRVRPVNPGSKSEGTAAWLESIGKTKRGDLRLYRPNMPDVGDPLFVGLDGIRVSIKGTKESPDYLCVNSLTVVDGAADKNSDNNKSKKQIES